LEWLEKAARQGDAKAQYNLAVMRATGRGDFKSDKKAVEWYEKAALQGHAGAQFRLACMHASGRGVSRNIVRACAWMNVAADNGAPSASKGAYKLELRMTEEQKIEAQNLARELAGAVQKKSV
jgi:hypothetical protein